MIARRSKVGGHFAKRVGTRRNGEASGARDRVFGEDRLDPALNAVDWLIGFGSAGDDFREGLLTHVLGLTWAMAGLYASYHAMVRPNSAICVCVERCVSLGSGSGRRGLAPGSPRVVLDLCCVIQQ